MNAAPAFRRPGRLLSEDPDDLTDVYRRWPTRQKMLKPADPTPVHNVPAAPLSPAAAASRLGIRTVWLAQAIREGKGATVRGRGGELMIAHDELERVRRQGVGA